MKFRTFNIQPKRKSILIAFAFMLICQTVLAIQELGQFGPGSGTPVKAESAMGPSELMYYALIVVAVVELITVITLAFAAQRLINVYFGVDLKQLAAKAKVETEKTQVKKAKWFSFERINKTVPIEKEGELIMDHDYDGIQELDNKMPPWFLWLFRVTIVFAAVYLMIFHVFGIGDLQIAEYRNELSLADRQMEEFRKKAANLVDENSVTLITDAGQLKAGQAIYKTNCVACHGSKGEGGVGPNLTDDYWLHGGSVKNIFKTIKYGVPEKGMKSWQQDLSPSQIQDITGFIKTLHGTNPPNAKEKQGELYKEGSDAKPADSVQNSPKTDSLKTVKK